MAPTSIVLRTNKLLSTIRKGTAALAFALVGFDSAASPINISGTNWANPPYGDFHISVGASFSEFIFAPDAFGATTNDVVVVNDVLQGMFSAPTGTANYFASGFINTLRDMQGNAQFGTSVNASLTDADPIHVRPAVGVLTYINVAIDADNGGMLKQMPMTLSLTWNLPLGSTAHFDIFQSAADIQTQQDVWPRTSISRDLVPGTSGSEQIFLPGRMAIIAPGVMLDVAHFADLYANNDGGPVSLSVSLAPVPEPRIYLMLLVGLALVGWVAKPGSGLAFCLSEAKGKT